MEIYKDLNSPENQQFEKLLNSQLSKNIIEEGKIIDGKITKITEKYVFIFIDLSQKRFRQSKIIFKIYFFLFIETVIYDLTVHEYMPVFIPVFSIFNSSYYSVSLKFSPIDCFIRTQAFYF